MRGRQRETTSTQGRLSTFLHSGPRAYVSVALRRVRAERRCRIPLACQPVPCTTMSSRKWGDLPGQAYILHNQVTHVRFLPEPSRHAFVYPTSSLLISLKALEEGKLNLLGGRLFGYGSVWNRVTGIKASGYLHDKPNDTRSITSKLKDLLTQYGHDRDALEDAWLMTVPSFLGVQVMNPLSVYFCYRRGDSMLWIVILEVSVPIIFT